VKALFAIGAVLSIAPFVPWGSFLSSSVTTGSGKRTLLQKVVVDDVSKYGPAAGKPVNVKDLTTFPPDGHWVITYPSSGDQSLDAQNPDTFLKYELIRLPTELGGSSIQATDFVAFSKVCVHLWCSPNYNPAAGHQQYECPCHGSIYRVPDGKAVQGPASLQPAPTNAIPMLTLQADASGNLYAYYPNYDQVTKQKVPDGIEADGELGFGRDFNSYQSFLKPKAQIPADLKDLTTEVK
jgi:rieske iron-sulfur protein